jgi:meso-butanediol dehydrogenase/(S,S)-butanediol dehydrogenase/diacetyl reductase
MYSLEGKVALVTGAGGEHGFGRAIAIRLAQEGADVAVSDLVDIPYTSEGDSWGGFSAVVGQIRALGRRGLSVTTDISNSGSVVAMVSEVVARLGAIDIFVANAGAREGPDHVPVVDLEVAVFDHVQRINVRGTFLCCREGARHQVSRGNGGKIIVISSLAGKRGVARYAAYSASKFALIGFTQSLAAEMGPYGVNVNAICPGFSITERATDVAGSLRDADTTTGEQIERMTRQRVAAAAMGRITEAEDVANLAAFLVSSEGDYLTGLALPVSGGEVM